MTNDAMPPSPHDGTTSDDSGDDETHRWPGPNPAAGEAAGLSIPGLHTDDGEPEEPEGRTWRRPALIAVAVVTIAAMALVPLYNVLGGNHPPIADNGLEVCGFDYCMIQDVVTAAGLDLVMSRLSTTFMNDDEAAAFAGLLLEHVGEPGVSFEVVDRLDGDIEGQYSPGERAIEVERPARAWIVLHEVAHVGTDDHGDDFQQALLDLTRWVESRAVS